MTGDEPLIKSQPRLNVVPIILDVANTFVQQLHRHHAPIRPGIASWCLGVVADEHVTGVAIAGRPINRMNEDGQTIEVLRLATDGTPNAPSALLGACARAAKAMGARRIITYTLETESGVSLRAAGWVRERDGIRSDWKAYGPSHASRGGASRRWIPPVPREHMTVPKVRWAVHFHDLIPYETVTVNGHGMSGQLSLLEESRDG